MAKAYEELCERGVLSYTADEAEGITVNSLMFRKRLTRVEPGRLWGLLQRLSKAGCTGRIGGPPTTCFVAEFPGVGLTPCCLHK